MISAVILDCDAKARKTLVKTLKARYNDVHISAEAETLKAARGAVTSFSPQLLFVEASAMGALLVEEVASSAVQIVVMGKERENTSAQMEFTYPNITGFLAKPFDTDVVQRCMERVRNSMMLQTTQKWLDEQLTRTFSTSSIDTTVPQAIKPLPRFSIATAKGNVVVKTESVLCCIAQDDYTEVHCITENGVKKYLDAKSLKVWEERLAAFDFMRVHKSHVVNMSAIIGFASCGKEGVVTLQGGKELAVSRTYKAAVTQAL